MVSLPCGTTWYPSITYSKTEIYNPGYPHNYGANLNCTYTIQKNILYQHVSYVLQVYFLSMHIPAGSMPDCEEEYLEISIGEGANRRNLGKFCGGETPYTIFSYKEHMNINLKSSSNGQGGSFVIQAGVKKYASQECPNGNLNSTSYLKSGTVTSPNYPNGYIEDQYCASQIYVGDGNIIRISVIDVNLFHVSSASCELEDYIELRGSSSPNSLSSSSLLDGVNKTCGSLSNVVTLTSDYNYVYIVFRSYHGSQGQRGFYLGYTVYSDPVTMSSGMTNKLIYFITASIFLIVLITFVFIITMKKKNVKKIDNQDITGEKSTKKCQPMHLPTTQQKQQLHPSQYLRKTQHVQLPPPQDYASKITIPSHSELLLKHPLSPSEDRGMTPVEVCTTSF